MPGPPELGDIVAAFDAAGAPCVVIGGFAVIANRYVRATEDTDLLIPDDDAAVAPIMAALEALSARFLHDGRPVTAADLVAHEHLRLDCGPSGILDLLKGGVPPLDYDSVAAAAIEARLGGHDVWFAGLASLVAFKRLAGRPRDRLDLEELERIHGPLPILPVPGLDEV